MQRDDILHSLFPSGFDIKTHDGLMMGQGQTNAGQRVHIAGIYDDTPLSIDGALVLAEHILNIAQSQTTDPIVLMIDSSSQNMSRRDELLGLNEYLAHLAKSIYIAEQHGHRTLGLLYGHSAAGAFIATALACEMLVALPEARPEVMDLPSIARVTKLSIDTLKEKAAQTPVFAPGLSFLTKTGAIAEVWESGADLALKLDALLAQPRSHDVRTARGLALGGRPRADTIVHKVMVQARQCA